MTMRRSEPALAEDDKGSSQSSRVPSEDWGRLRQAGLLRQAGHEPLILAFVSSPTVGGDEADVERIRVEVRGLGITLMLISHDTVWCFGADDSLRKLRAPADVDAAALHDLFGRFGMTRGADAVLNSSPEGADVSGLRAVFVIDPGFVLRFAHIAASRQVDRGRPVQSTLELLLRALVAASVAFERRRTPGLRLSFTELTTLAVVSGLQRVLLGQEDREIVTTKAPPPVAQGSLGVAAVAVASMVVPPFPWPPQVNGTRHAPEAGRHPTRTVEAPIRTATSASS